jgi:glycosyltransferase involved in cell wall biosynthesis
VIVLGMEKYFQIRPLWRLYSLFRKERVDLIHTHLYRDAVYGRVIARLAGVKGVISTLHNSYVWRSRSQLFLDRLTSVFADRITAVSDAVREFAIEREHMPPGKLITVYNGIDTGQFKIPPKEREAVRRELGLAPGEVAVGSMGELTEQKGYRYLLEAVPGILKSNPAVKFFIAGEGELKKTLLVLRDELGLNSRVSFLGFRDDVPRLLAAFDIFVLPSLWEGLPVALIEAMAAGKPIVATDVDGNCEVIGRDEAGLAVESRDPGGLARALIQLIDDPGLRDRMGRKGQKRADDLFSLKVMIANYQELYETCLL